MIAPARPLVSILVATYQHVNFIAAALESAVTQTYPDIEIVIADDGSTDGTTEIAQSYAHRYPDRVTLMPRRPNTGIFGIAGNSLRAFKQCRGKYFCILEGDDMYLPRKVETQVDWMEQDEQRVLCAHDVEVFDSDTGDRLYNFADLNPLSAGSGADAVVRRRFRPCTPSVMTRTAAMPVNAWDSRLRVICDWHLWCGCLAPGGRYGFVDGIHARYRQHQHNMMKSPAFEAVRLEDQLMTLEIMQADYPELGSACREGRARVLGWHALGKLRQEDVASARRFAIAALKERAGLRGLALAAFAHLPAGIVKKVVRRRVSRPRRSRTALMP